MDLATNVRRTKLQLYKLHSQCFQFSAKKILNLFQRSRPERTGSGTLSVLQDLLRSCDPFQRIQSAARRVRTLFGSEKVLSTEVLILDSVTTD